MGQNQIQDPALWVPEEVPVDKPSPARIYDYLLGGYHNFECDRKVVDQMLEQYPDMMESAQVNRGFLRRAVHYLLKQGIDQFLDIGSGIPTVGNVHELAQAYSPEARVYYVDIDPIAVSHSKAILEDNPNAAAIQADVRDTDKILNHPEVVKLLDFNKPLGLMIVATIHYVVDDEDAQGAVERLRNALSVGSYLTLSQPVDIASPENMEDLKNSFKPAANTKIRSREDIAQFFSGLEIIEPGLVFAPQWRPESPNELGLDHPEKSFTLAAIGRK